MLDHNQHSTSASISISKSVPEPFQSWQDASVREQIAGHILDKIVPIEVSPDGFMRWVGPDAAPPHYRGSIHFHEAPADYGTEVMLTLEPSDEPDLMQKIHLDSAEKAAKMMAGKILRHFKSLMETGEIPNLHANPSTRNNVDEK